MEPGKHLILDLYGCKADLLNDYEKLEYIFEDTLCICNATVLNVIGNKFEPQGVTLLALLAESHASIHTWPEHNYCAVDFYTCGDFSRPQGIADHLFIKFGAKSRLERTLDRTPKLCIFKEEYTS